jgi:hypothetical protein
MNIGFFQMSEAPYNPAFERTQAEAAPSSAASRRTRRRRNEWQTLILT